MKVLCIGINEYIKKNLIQFATNSVKYCFIEESDITGLKFIDNLSKFNEYSSMIIGIDFKKEYNYSSEKYIEILTNLLYIVSTSESLSKVVFLSSYGVYKEKEDDNNKYKESDNIEPKDYKSALYYYYENMLSCGCERNNKKLVIIRLFNVFGLYQSRDFIITYLVDEMLKNTNELFIGDTRKKRDYVYIRDFIRFLNIIIYNEFEKNINLYNFGMGQSYSIKQIIDIIKEILNRNKEIVFNPNKIRTISDYSNVIADISKIQSEFNFEFEYSIKDALENYIELFKIHKEK